MALGVVVGAEVCVARSGAACWHSATPAAPWRQSVAAQRAALAERGVALAGGEAPGLPTVRARRGVAALACPCNQHKQESHRLLRPDLRLQGICT